MPNPFTNMTQFIVRNPVATAAAILSPLFAKNEDRGYFRTALVTTPAIFAASELVPKMFSGVRDVTGAIKKSGLLKKAGAWIRPEGPTFHTVEEVLSDVSAGHIARERALSAYLVTERHIRNIEVEAKSIERYFFKRFAKTPELIAKANKGDIKAISRIAEIEELQSTKGSLITNALESARKSSLTPSEWFDESSRALPNLTNEGLIEEFQKLKSTFAERPRVLQELRNRLREIPRLNIGEQVVTDLGPKAQATTLLDVFDLGESSSWTNDFRSKFPEVFGPMKRAEARGLIKDIKLEYSASGSDELGKLINVHIQRREGSAYKDLILPLVDKETGQVRLGSNSIGVGNYVIGPDKKPYRIDEWISKMLVEQPHLKTTKLKEEIAAHAYWFGGDPLDSRRLAELRMFGQTEIFGEQAIKLRSHAAGVTKLPLFGTKDKARTFEKFTAEEQVNFIQDIINTNRYITMGSEASPYEGRWILREAANLSPFGSPSAEKQDPIWRSVTKEWKISPVGELSEEARLGWGSTAWKGLTGSESLPGAKFTVASLNPQDRTLFSELPDTIAELESQKGKAISTFVDRGMATEAAEAMYEDIHQIYATGDKRIFEYLGDMGETGFVMNPEFAGKFRVTGERPYRVDQLHVKVGDRVSPEDVIGFNKNSRVVPKFEGEVVSIGSEKGGESLVNVRHSLSMQGAKLDIAGIKGMNRVPLSDAVHNGQTEWETLRDVMNRYYSRIGSSNQITSDVNLLAPAEYFAEKVEPMHAYLGMGSEVVNRLDKQGLVSEAQTYLDEMAIEGVTYKNNQLVIDATKNTGTSTRLARITEINDKFFSEIGEKIKGGIGVEDPIFSAFSRSSDKGIKQWMMQNALPVTGFSWDHSLVNRPRFATISYDIETHMALGGHHAALRAMKRRLVTTSGGDPAKSREFLDYVIKGDFTQGLAKKVNVADIAAPSSGLANASGRHGTLFDPSLEEFKESFRLELSNGRTVPVPGTSLYRAEAPMFDEGMYQTHPWQHTLQELMTESDPKKMKPLERKLTRQYKRYFGVGKGSALRPYQYDPLAPTGFLSTTAERGDLFVAKVGEDFVKTIHSKRVRAALMNGESVTGVMQRQPTNEMMYMKYQLDRRLKGTYDVAVPEAVSRAFMGDQDKDLTTHILFDANIRTENGKLKVYSAADNYEREAAEQALEHMAKGGLQERQLAIWRDIKGNDEIAKYLKDFELSDLTARSQKFAEKVANRTGITIKRTAGAAIGHYSNVLTTITEQMAHNPVLMQDPEMVQRLKVGFFDIRQAPISARKAHVAFDLETAIKQVELLRKAIDHPNPQTAAEKTRNIMMTMSRTLSPKGQKGPEYAYWAGKGLSDLQPWANHRSEEARLLSKLYTTSTEDLTAQGAKALNETLKRASDIGLNRVLGPIHGGSGAIESTSRLGVIAEGLANIGREASAKATGEIGRIFKANGGKIALGFGALAALGIALTPGRTPVARFGVPSGNKYRPESMIGTSDNIPGEPIPGQRAPSAPPRRLLPANQGVRTAVVAPLSRTSELSVQMRSTDYSKAADMTRLLAQIPGTGETNVTVNYRDRTRLRSLRTREKIRGLDR